MTPPAFPSRSLALALAVAMAACSDAPAPERWVSLAEGFEPATRIGSGDAWKAPFTGGEPLLLHAERGGTGAWVTHRIAAEDWQPAPFGPGVWRALRPIPDLGVPAEEGIAPQRLRVDGVDQTFVPFTKEILQQELKPKSFTGVIEFVYLKTEGPRPRDAEYTVYVERGEDRDGRWRVGVERYACDGIPVWSGHGEEVRSRVPAASVLSFATVGAATAQHLGEPAGEVRFRVLLDGEPIFEAPYEVFDFPQAVRHRVVLPPEARDSARFRFEVEGPAAVCAVLDPKLVPAEVGTPTSRPHLGGAAEQPSVLLFLADTFRADNMHAYGERFDPSLTPHLDRFGDESVLFTRAWSPGSWTLPSQASMLSGLYPHQHGADRSKRRIADRITTLAEAFAAAGYRTAAITDSLIVSRRFGFDQGFQWFDEKKRELSETLAEVRDFLDADDGRPFFLFVQTYRTHSPYKATPRTRAEYADQLDISGTWGSLNAELEAETRKWTPGEPITDGIRAVVRRLERLYRGGAVDLDRGFGELLADFEARELDESAWIVFTSDHGEAFGEQDILFHGNGVWEANVRIPLAIRGPGLAARREDGAATLVDLPRTIARFTGIPVAPGWGGRDLLGEHADPPAFSFECPASGEPGTAAIIDGPRKLVFDDTDEAIAARELIGAFELTGDPYEQTDRCGPGVAWPGELFDEHARELTDLRRALHKAPRARLRAKDIEDLAAVGYVDVE